MYIPDRPSLYSDLDIAHARGRPGLVRCHSLIDLGCSSDVASNENNTQPSKLTWTSFNGTLGFQTIRCLHRSLI